MIKSRFKLSFFNPFNGSMLFAKETTWCAQQTSLYRVLHLTNLMRFLMNFSAKIFISVLPRYRTRYDAISGYGAVFIRWVEWLSQAGVQASDCFLSTISARLSLKLDFCKILSSCHDFLASYPRNSRCTSDDL